MVDIQKFTIQVDATILEAMRQMDRVQRKMLLAFEQERFYSILTIGEIQRAIIRNESLTSPIKDIIRLDKKGYASVSDSEESIKAHMLKIRAQFMPVMDEENNLVKVYAWEDFFSSEKANVQKPQIDVPVVIMAGGKGTRLKPLTNVIPKPMVPIGEKTILQEIMDQFESIGCSKFYMSVNFKVDMLKYYLDNLDHKYDIDFFQEDKPLGTIGSVSLLKGKITTPFFVSNCDIIIDQDYKEVYDYHVSNHNDITIVTAVKSFKIPYGVIETGEDGLMVGLKEKPDITYMINTGVYILNPSCIDKIPAGQFFHITDLMETVKRSGGRVGCFPVSEHAWKDMGEWSEYLRMINVL